MSRTAWLITLLVLVLLGGLGLWVMRHFEKQEISLPTGLTGEAATNPLLAAERFLNIMGVTATHLDDSTDLLDKPQSGDVILITSDRQTLGQGRTRALLDWVRRGGRLVVTVPHLPDEEMPPNDPLLKALKLDLRYIEPDTTDYADYLDVDLPGADDFLQVEFGTDYVLSGAHESDRVVANDWGLVMIQRQLGRGTVTVLSDLDFIQYRRIGDYDHARFLWYLVNGKGKVWLIFNNDMPPLWDWLWDHAAETMTASALLLATWLWSRSRRFGPLRGVPVPARRRILEHIDANGRFLWHQRRSAYLIGAVRNALLTSAARRYPAWASLTDSARAVHLGDLVQRDPDTVQRMLGTRTVRHRHEFTRLIRQLETIRKKL
jgi:hypothetical protein